MEEINGFYDDDGNKINMDLIKKPGLCLLCKRDDWNDPMENLLCNMNRYDQRNEEEFKCGVYNHKWIYVGVKVSYTYKSKHIGVGHLFA